MQQKSPDFTDKWYVLRCMTNREADLQNILISHGIIAWTAIYRKNKKEDAVLFPSYLFVQGELDEWPIKLVDLPFSLGFLRFGNQSAIVTAQEMNAVRSMLASGELIKEWRDLVLGERVKVIKGSMTGVEGVVTKLKGADHLVVNLPLMGRAVGVVLDREWVEPLE